MAKEFERDLDEYLSARKRASPLSAIFSRFTPKRSVQPETPKVPEQVEVYEEKSEPKPSFFARISDKFSSKRSEDELLKMQAEDAVSDMKEIARISLGMIKVLPDAQLKAFKHSPEFEKLKTILKKHELIK